MAHLMIAIGLSLVVIVSVLALLFLSLSVRIDRGRMADIEVIRTEAETARAELAVYEFHASDLVIQNDTDFARAQAYIAKVKGIAKQLSTRLAQYVDPLKAVIELAKADVGPRLSAANAIEAKLKTKCLEYRQAVTALRVVREAEAAKLLAAPTAPIAQKREALVAVAETIATVRKGTSFRDHWIWHVKNEAEIPESYFVRVLDTARINREVKAGARSIAGLEIVNEPIMATNSED